MMKRLLFFVVIIILCFMLCVPAFATINGLPNTETPVVSGILVISDPNSGEQWTWAVSAADISVGQVNRARNSSGQVQEAEVCIDIGEYLLQTMPRANAQASIEDNIELIAGLSYTYNGGVQETISISRAYGSAYNSGLYLVTSKEFAYRNPGVFDWIYKYPTAESWSYTTNSSFGEYNAMQAPAAMLTCRITVAGMEHSYRDVTVMCKLDSLG